MHVKYCDEIISISSTARHDQCIGKTLNGKTVIITIDCIIIVTTSLLLFYEDCWTSIFMQRGLTHFQRSTILAVAVLAAV